MSGCTRAGEAKAGPLAKAERAAREHLKFRLLRCASLGNDLDKILTRAGIGSSSALSSLTQAAEGDKRRQGYVFRSTLKRNGGLASQANRTG